jgi:hypothetical protein
MKRLLAVFVSAAIAALFAHGRLRAQSADDLRGDYIEAELVSLFGAMPQLAWTMPDGTIITQGQEPSIYLYTADRLREARQLSALTRDQAMKLRSEQHVACDIPALKEDAVFSLYTAGRPPRDGPQLLATARAIPGTALGFDVGTLTGKAAKEAWATMEPVSPDQPRLSGVIRREGVPEYFSLAALYTGPDKQVARTGVFLHAANGKILGRHREEIRGKWCEGCAMPTFADGLPAVFAIRNMLTIPGFAFPLLIADTSTVEGRSLTLETFSADGRYSRHLFYEYVVGCSAVNP